MRILFLTARLPWPLLRGDQVRAYQQLRLLAPRHRTTLVSFGDAPLPEKVLAAVAPFCERLVAVPRAVREAVAGEVFEELHAAARARR